MRIVLITRGFCIVAQQCLPWVKDFSASLRMLWAKETGKGQLIPTVQRDILTKWNHDQYINWGPLLRDWLGISRWWTTALCITCFTYSNSIVAIIIFPISLLLNQPYLKPWMSLVFFPILSSIPAWPCGVQLPVRLNHNAVSRDISYLAVYHVSFLVFKQLPLSLGVRALDWQGL